MTIVNAATNRRSAHGRLWPRLTSLVLEGFQVFRERTEIPFTPLTLLYGPNSAGKSATYDALQLLAEFWQVTPRETAPGAWKFAEGRNRMQQIHREWRQGPGGDYEAPAMEVGVKLTTPRRHALPRAGLAQRFDAESKNRDEVILEAAARFIGEPSSARLEVDISVDGEPVYRFIEFASVSIRLGHPLFGRMPVEPYSEAGSPFEVDGEWVKLYGDVHVDGTRELNWFELLDILAGQDFSEPNRGKAAALSRFNNLHYRTVQQWAHLISRVCSTTLVSASRTVPTDEELLYCLAEDLSPDDGRQFALRLNPRAEFAAVARSAALAALKLEMSQELTATQNAESELIETINKALGSYLSTDRGYRVVAAVTKLSPLVASYSQTDEQRIGMLVRLALQDRQGRKLSFTDVGSGIGYALPVIGALTSPQSCFIQQPELHLHPALQASLADAFVRRSRRSRRTVIIETHSEHLLLRLLRRVRTAKSGLGGPSTLSNEDISVVYFDPALDGTTEVHRILITASGEFDGRWPKGFFPERTQELFDE